MWSATHRNNAVFGLLFFASLHIVPLGSTHAEDLVVGFEIANPDVCFLCQVSPFMEFLPPAEIVQPVSEGIDEHEERRDEQITIPTVSTLEARAPPLATV